VVLAVSLLFTLLATTYVSRAINSRERLRFQNESQHARKSIEDRLEVYTGILRATAGLFAADPHIDAAAFRRYARRLMADARYADVQGIGFSVKVDPAHAKEFTARMRREGLTGFHLWANAPAPELHAITYLEPNDFRNQRAVGYNMFSEPTRREAMEKARDTGAAAASGVVRLVQELSSDPRPQRGFLVYVPVFREGAPAQPATVEQRRAHLIGFAYSPFRMKKLVDGIFPRGEAAPNIRFDIYDDGVQTSQHRLYRSAAPGARAPRFKTTTSIDVGGRSWTAVFATQPEFDRASDRVVVPITLLGGIVLSLLLFGITWFQVRSRQAAERAAAALRTSIFARESAEAAVREGENRLRYLYEEARAARAEAETANRLKDDFLATVSHELRTPLNAVLGYSQLLGMGGRSPEQVRRAVEAIERNVKSQAQLIDDLLDVSRIVSGKLRLELQPVEPATVVHNAVEAVAPSAAAKSVALVTTLDPAAGPVRGDAGRLQQVVWNLLSNAIKFTPEGGRVEVRLARAGDNVELAVRDTGRGIPPDMLSHVFDRFRQADSSTTRQYGGLGLGLSIVRQLVEMHGGTVRAESQGEDHGSVFTVTLPVAPLAEPGEPPPPTEHGEERAAPGRLDGARVLAVDDDADVRSLLCEVLEAAGADVAVASSVAEAVEALETFAPDVLLSDIAMPGEDGYALIRRVRAWDSGEIAAIPAAALTAFAGEENRRKALDAGFHRHSSKPIDPAALISLVAELMHIR
jgi:signal transduction histidine kinase